MKCLIYTSALLLLFSCSKKNEETDDLIPVTLTIELENSENMGVEYSEWDDGQMVVKNQTFTGTYKKITYDTSIDSVFSRVLIYALSDCDSNAVSLSYEKKGFNTYYYNDYDGCDINTDD